MYVYVSFPWPTPKKIAKVAKKVTLLKCHSSEYEDQTNGTTCFPAIVGSNFEIFNLNFSSHCITK